MKAFTVGDPPGPLAVPFAHYAALPSESRKRTGFAYQYSVFQLELSCGTQILILESKVPKKAPKCPGNYAEIRSATCGM